MPQTAGNTVLSIQQSKPAFKEAAPILFTVISAGRICNSWGSVWDFSVMGTEADWGLGSDGRPGPIVSLLVNLIEECYWIDVDCKDHVGNLSLRRSPYGQVFPCAHGRESSDHEVCAATMFEELVGKSCAVFQSVNTCLECMSRASNIGDYDRMLCVSRTPYTCCYIITCSSCQILCYLDTRSRNYNGLAAF